MFTWWDAPAQTHVIVRSRISKALVDVLVQGSYTLLCLYKLLIRFDLHNPTLNYPSDETTQATLNNPQYGSVQRMFTCLWMRDVC
jgi:hypothetical protein